MTATQHLKEPARWASVSLLAFAAFGSSQAADPVAGASRYAPDCFRSGCHTSADPIASPTAKIQNGRNAMTVIDNAISRNTGGMGVLRSTYPSGGTALANMAAYLGNSPATVTFPSTAVGSTSPTQTVTVRASPSANLTGIAITTSAEFTRSGGTCGTTLGVGTSCTVLVTFSPTAIGTRTGSLSISHNRTPTPVLIALSGPATGGTAAPVASAAPTSLVFASTVIGTPSAASTVTLNNTGTAALNLSNITATGDFAYSGGTTNPCAAGVPVAAGSSCTARVVFTPTTTGTRTGTLTFTHNAGVGSTAVSLSGTGANAPAPVVSLSPTSVGFGGQQVGTSSAARAVILTNSGNAALTISSISLAAPFSATHNCPSTLTPGTNCTINAVFSPTALGGASASLTINDNAAGSPHAVPLSGTGSAAALPVLAWSAAALSLPSSPTGAATPTTRSAMLTNQGPGSVTLTSLTFSGANAGEFSLETGTTCVANAVLAASATCNVVVGFTPAATGIRSASLLVASTGTNPQALALSGSGTAPAVAQLTVVPSSVAITAAPASLGEQTISISNTGTAPLSITQIAVGSGPFTVQPATTGGCVAGPFNLQPNSSCDVTVTWTNTSTSSDTGTLQVMGSTGLLQTIGASAQRASPQAVTPPGTGATPSLDVQNQGAGGCTISQGRTPADPVLWLLAALAAGALSRRRRAR